MLPVRPVGWRCHHPTSCRGSPSHPPPEVRPTFMLAPCPLVAKGAGAFRRGRPIVRPQLIPHQRLHQGTPCSQETKMAPLLHGRGLHGRQLLAGTPTRSLPRPYRRSVLRVGDIGGGKHLLGTAPRGGVSQKAVGGALGGVAVLYDLGCAGVVSC